MVIISIKMCGIQIRITLIFKLFYSFRDPVKRLISDYVQRRILKRKTGEKNHTFEEMVFTDSSCEMINHDYSPVHISKYHIHLSRWLQYFPRNQILVLDGELFAEDPIPGLKTVEKFLGVKPYIGKKHFVFVETRGPKGFYCRKYRGNPYCVPAKGRNHPNISEVVLKGLYDLYKPHNQMFYNLVGQSFNWDR